MVVRTPPRCALAACAALALACSDGAKPPPDDAFPSVEVTPAGGTFSAHLTVTLACNDDHGPCASLRYTTDGSEPTPSSLVYAGEIPIVRTTTLKYLASDSSGHTVFGSQRYVVDPDAPIVIAIPPGGLFDNFPAVQLSCSDGFGSGCAEIRYTVDGTAPTASSPAYGSPLVVPDGTVLRFVAFDRAGNASAEAREEYHVDRMAPVTWVSPEPGAFRGPLEVTLSCTDGTGSGCAAIHYTTDGTVATTLSPLYEAPLHLQGTTTVELLGVDRAGNVEAPHRVTYLVDTEAPVTTISPVAGAYGGGRTISLACADVGSGCAGTYYTLDGSDPFPGGVPYTAPFPVGEPPGSVTVRYASVDAAGNMEAAREAGYVIDATPPEVSAEPAGGLFRSPIMVALSCRDLGGAECSVIRYTTDGSDPRWGTPYTAAIPIATPTTLRFLARDRAGNESAAATAYYTFDTSPPRVLASSPVDGAAAADPATQIRITFDEALDPAALAATVDGAAAPTAYDSGSRTVTITPAAPLAPDAPCTVALTGVRDVPGNTAPAPITLTFRTRGTSAPFGAAGSATIVAHALAYDAAGNAVAVFGTDAGKGRKVLYARYDAATAAWTPEVELDREATKTANAFPVAVASHGDGFLVAWSTAGAVKARFVAGDGKESADVPLWAAPATELRVATNGAGYAVIASVGGAYASRVWDGDPVQPVWSLPEVFGAGSGLAVAAEGPDYVVTYLGLPSSGARSVMFARLAGMSGWSTSYLYTTALPLGAPAIAANAPSSGVAVAFTVQDAVGAVFASVGTGDFMSTPAVIANAPQATNASVAAEGYGFAVAWQGLSGARTTTSARVYRGGVWSAATDLATTTGTPAGTRVASSGIGFVALAATSDGGTTRLLAFARPDTSWSASVDAAPADASATSPSVVPAPGGYAISFAQDDGARHQLRVRSHTGAAGDTALGAPVGVVSTVQPGTVRELRVAGDGLGGAMATWTQVHRGTTAVFAARAAHGAYGDAVLVAPAADAPAIAPTADGFVIAYRAGARCEVRTVTGAGVSSPTVLADGAAGACSAPAIASDGSRHVAAWRAGASRVQAAVFDGAAWSAATDLDTGASYGGAPDVGAGAGDLLAAWPAGSSGAASYRKFGWSPPAWSATAALENTTWAADSLRVAAGPAGVAIAWIRSGYVWAAVAPTGTLGSPMRLSSLGSPRSLALAAGKDGFLAAWDASGVTALEFRNGAWAGQSLTYKGTDVRVAAGDRGYALLLRETASGALRSTSVVDHAFQPVLLVLPSGVGAALAAGWDGETYDAVWTETDPADSTVERPVSRRGL